MEKFECGMCEYTYDPAKGDPGRGIAPESVDTWPVVAGFGRSKSVDTSPEIAGFGVESVNTSRVVAGFGGQTRGRPPRPRTGMPAAFR